MFQNTTHNLITLIKVALWHGHADLLLEPGRWCYLVKQLLMNAGRLLLMSTNP